MKSLLRFFLFIIVLGLSAPTWAATPWSSWVGPKITNTFQVGEKTAPIFIPGDFSAYEFLGGDPIDASVPANGRFVIGAKNLNKWEEAGPNTFFDTNFIHSGAMTWQVLHGNFDGNGTDDIIVISLGLVHFKVCYDYNGQSCVGGEASVRALKDSTVSPDEPKNQLHPVFGRVADLNGDGKDDLALITWDHLEANQGDYIFFPGTGTGGASPFGAFKSVRLDKMTPFSIAVADFNKDNKLDVAIGSTFHGSGNPGIVSILLNQNPGPDIHAFNAAEDMANQYKNCTIPFGLEAQDANGDGFSDLVMTCMLQIIQEGQVAKRTGGPVIILKNLAAGGKTFNVEQTITRTGEPGLNYPTRTAVGDVDSDGKYDLAVAEWGGKAVRVYHGSDTFKVDLDTVRVLDSKPYPPMFIQYQDENQDGRLDIILTANSFGNATRNNIKYTSDALDVSHVSQYPGLVGNICVKRDTIPRDSADSAIWVVQRDQLEVAPLEKAESAARVMNTSDSFQETRTLGTSDYALRGAYVSEKADTRLGGTSITDAVPQLCDGILVYLNFDPEVTFGDVDCNSSTISFQCKANGGNEITSCEVSSPDATLEVVTTPAAPSWEGAVKVPGDKKKFTVQVIAKDNGGGTYTGTLNVDLENCPVPGTANCPVDTVKSTVWPREPFSLCVPPEMADKAVTFGSTIEWEQVAGPDLLGIGDDKAFTYKGISAEGPCITGAFELGPTAFQKEEFKFNYVVKNVGGQDLKCPAELVKLQAQAEGSGLGSCSLQRGSNAANSGNIILGFLFLMSLFLGKRVYAKVGRQG